MRKRNNFNLETQPKRCWCDFVREGIESKINGFSINDYSVQLNSIQFISFSPTRNVSQSSRKFKSVFHFISLSHFLIFSSSCIDGVSRWTGKQDSFLENSLSFHCYSFAARWTSSARFVRGKIVSNSPSLSSHNSHPCEAKAQINGTHIRTSELIVNNKNSMISILAARKHSKA